MIDMSQYPVTWDKIGVLNSLEGFKDGPYEVDVYKADQGNYHVSCIRNKHGKPVWSGSPIECQKLCEEWNQLTALRVMVTGTAAAGFTDCPTKWETRRYQK